MPHSPRPYATAAAIRTALSRFQRRTEDLCRPHGLTGDQFTLLLLIAGGEDGRSTVGTLAERLALSHNGVAERVARAVDAGLVERSPSPEDRRVSVLCLTAEGARRLAGAYADLGPESDRLMTALREADLEP